MGRVAMVQKEDKEDGAVDEGYKNNHALHVNIELVWRHSLLDLFRIPDILEDFVA